MYARADSGFLDDLDDAQLVSEFRNGNDLALHVLLRRHSDALYRFCLRLAPTREDAEDIYQESLARAIGRVDSLAAGGAFRTWLFRIARNLLTDSFRSRKRLCRLPEGDEPPPPLLREDGPQSNIELDEEHQTVSQAFRRLAESHQRVLLLREVEGLSYNDIAQRLNVSQSAVETLLFRARRRLRQEYSKGERATTALGLVGGIRALALRLCAPLASGGSVATKVAVTAVVIGGAAATAHSVMRERAPHDTLSKTTLGPMSQNPHAIRAGAESQVVAIRSRERGSSFQAQEGGRSHHQRHAVVLHHALVFRHAPERAVAVIRIRVKSGRRGSVGLATHATVRGKKARGNTPQARDASLTVPSSAGGSGTREASSTVPSKTRSPIRSAVPDVEPMGRGPIAKAAEKSMLHRPMRRRARAFAPLHGAPGRMKGSPVSKKQQRDTTRSGAERGHLRAVSHLTSRQAHTHGRPRTAHEHGRARSNRGSESQTSTGVLPVRHAGGGPALVRKGPHHSGAVGGQGGKSSFSGPAVGHGVNASSPAPGSGVASVAAPGPAGDLSPHGNRDHQGMTVGHGNAAARGQPSHGGATVQPAQVSVTTSTPAEAAVPAAGATQGTGVAPVEQPTAASPAGSDVQAASTPTAVDPGHGHGKKP